MGIWVDTDMGVDDLMALVMLIDGAGVDGISLVFGCAALDQVRGNALAFLAAYGLDIPLYQGGARALDGSCETCERILGPSGQPSRGGRFPAVPDHELPAALAGLTGWLDGQSDAVILALGPLTNLARLVQARPDILPRIGRIVWMGGSVGRGNHSAFAEFNAFADPEALDVVLTCGIPLTMVDLEACRKVIVGPAHLAGMPAKGALADLVGGYLDIGLSRGRPGMALYDPVAAAVILRPDLFAFEKVALSVELNDAARRGQTIATPGQGTGRIIRDVQADAVRDTILTAMRDPA